MDTMTIIGFAAAIFSTLSFLPQALKTIKTKKTKDLSLKMYIIYSIGVILWLLYGIMLKSIPIILANIVTLIFTIIILYQVIQNERHTVR